MILTLGPLNLRRNKKSLKINENIVYQITLFKKFLLLCVRLESLWKKTHLLINQSSVSFFIIFLNVGPPKESIFLTTIYGLYFSHHYIHYKLHFMHDTDLLWAAFSIKGTPWLYTSPVCSQTHSIMVFKFKFIKYAFQSEINKFSPLPGFEPGTTLVASS